MYEWIIARRDAFEKRINAKLDHAVAALDELKARRRRQIELELAGSDWTEAFKRAQAERSRHEVEEVFDEYLECLRETMTTEPRPWIKVVCAMTGEGSGEGSEGGSEEGLDLSRSRGQLMAVAPGAEVGAILFRTAVSS